MNTFEGDEIMMKKPKIIQVEVDDNWKRRNMKLKKFKSKFEIEEIKRMDLRLKCEGEV